jgi:general stress protein 26
MPDSEHSASSRTPAARRPTIPTGYGEPDPQAPPGTSLPWAVVEDWLVNARTYWLTTTRPDGRPHAVPLWAVWLPDGLYFSTGAETATARNLAANPAALAHPGDGDRVAIIEGTVEGLSDPATLGEFAQMYQRKYDWTIDPEAPPGPIYRLTPARVLSWNADENLVGTMTRWEFAG